MSSSPAVTDYGPFMHLFKCINSRVEGQWMCGMTTALGRYSLSSLHKLVIRQLCYQILPSRLLRVPAWFCPALGAWKVIMGRLFLGAGCQLEPPHKPPVFVAGGP